ncbi:MAG TPA: RIP metalloprotease RseP [Burkholderiaceae bacterium]|nr:RIP metalloprotease RseP [Burkholderiaceae bacterium]
MTTLLAFLAALGLLIAIHEYGHYRMAVVCGVKVLKFSIGFGKTIFKWQPKHSDTEFVIGLLPLGGFVKMLDEREGAVEPAQRHMAFNTQSLWKRSAIVAAGPIANLLLAIVLYAAVNWIGVQEPKAIIASPTAESLAQEAGFKGGEHILQAAFVNDDWQAIDSLEEFRWLLTRGALNKQDVKIQYAHSEGGASQEVSLPLSKLDVHEVDSTLFQKIGILAPWSAPTIGAIQTASAAERAGLKEGDLVLSVGSVDIVDAQQLRQTIRGSIHKNGLTSTGLTQEWLVERAGQKVNIKVEPDVKIENQTPVGKIGAYVGSVPALTTVNYGLLEGFSRAINRTWEVSVLTVRMFVKMIIGEASLKNLSGPLTIADYAGKSAQLGMTSYLVFLALISVSLGVLNLMPLPVLDGGHLVYYVWEAITGNQVSEHWMERFQRGGVAILFTMMFIALYNDLIRLFVNT